MRPPHEVLALARQADWAFPTSSGPPVPGKPDWLARLAAEREAFAAATDGLAAQGENEAADELAARAWRVFVHARDEGRGRAWLASVLDAPAPSDSRWRALALYGDGLLAFRLGDLSASRSRSEAALEVAGRVEDREAMGLAHLGVCRVDLSAGRGEEARTHAVASREFLSTEGARFGQAPLHMLAQAARLLGDYDAAAAFFEESLAANRRLGDHPMVAIEHHNLGHVELSRGDVDAAEAHFSACERLAPPAGDPYGEAMTAFNQAAVAFARGDSARARSRLDVARSFKITLADDDAREFEALARKLRP